MLARASILLTLLFPATAGAEGIVFREVSTEWGLAFRHHHGGSGLRYYPETDGSGVVFFDYDDDGDPDVLFVDSAALPGYRGEAPRSILYRNEGRGRFVDVTERSGLRIGCYGMGAVGGDVDGDGDLDLYVTCYDANLLFRNEGDGTFTDVTAAAGVGDPLWSMSAAFADVDRDGDLDLYVTNYLDYSIDEPVLCYSERLKVGTYCHPDLFAGLPDRFYRNRGDGTFEDATAEAGFGAADGKGMGVVFADFDDDGWPDVYVANDTTPNSLFRNRGDGTFEDVSLLSGTAFSDRGASEAGMGVAVGDVDGGGWLDIYVTNFSMESNALYRNLGKGLFVDARHVGGVAQPSLPKLGFGAILADLDQDGDLDLAVANGHVNDNVELIEGRADVTYRQRNQVLANRGAGRFEEVEGSGIVVERVSRGLAAGDLDGDGDLDLAFTNSNDLAEVYENVAPAPGGWLQIDLAPTSPRRQAIGSRLHLDLGSRTLLREVVSSDSYLSAGPTTVHFGTGDAETATALRIRWSDGTLQKLHHPSLHRRLRLRDPSPSPH